MNGEVLISVMVNGSDYDETEKLRQAMAGEPCTPGMRVPSTYDHVHVHVHAPRGVGKTLQRRERMQGGN